MRILVVGAGAVGGFFGAKWADAGRDVTFLLRESRRKAIAATGLVIRGAGQDLSLQPRMITASEIGAAYDVVLLAVPGDSLDAAMADISPAMGPGTILLSTLNGVRHFDILRERFGPDRALPSVAKCLTQLDSHGQILALAPLAQLAFGPWDGAADERLPAIVALLNTGGVEARLSDNITFEVNEKWLMMAALGAASCLLGGDVGTINSVPNGAFTIQQILREAVLALQHIGRPVRQDTVATISRMLADRTSHQTSSLYRNMAAGRPLELEPILGELIDKVEPPGAFPLLGAAYARLAIYMRALERKAAAS